MILLISDEELAPTLDTYKLTSQQFLCKEYHPFISTKKWEQIVIDLSHTKIPNGFISQLIPYRTITPKVNFEDLPGNAKLMNKICECLPNHNGEIREAFKKDESEYVKYIQALLSC